MLNKKVLKILNISEDEYVRWCKRYNKAPYLTKTKSEFFEGVQSGRIVRDAKATILNAYLES